MRGEVVLVIEDEKDVLELVSYNLQKEGYQVICATTGEKGLVLARTKTPSLIVLDLMLPGVDGLEVCRRLKEDPVTREIPVVMLTAKGEETDIVVGLEMGADDYITKPFSPRVLLARLRAVLRRKASSHAAERPGVIRVHNLTIDPNRHKVLVGNTVVELTRTEFQILYLLASQPGWVFSRGQIVEAIHGDNYPVTERSVDVQIASVRRKLHEAGEYIETVRGVGYRLREE